MGILENGGLRFVSVNGDRVPSVVYEKKKADTRFQTHQFRNQVS